MLETIDPTTTRRPAGDVARWLAELYVQDFGGRPRGRFRVSMKHLRRAFGCRRVYPDDLAALARALFEHGYVLVDMESYIVVISQKTFSSYRRANEGCLP